MHRLQGGWNEKANGPINPRSPTMPVSLPLLPPIAQWLIALACSTQLQDLGHYNESSISFTAFLCLYSSLCIFTTPKYSFLQELLSSFTFLPLPIVPRYLGSPLSFFETIFVNPCSWIASSFFPPFSGDVSFIIPTDWRSDRGHRAHC